MYHVMSLAWPRELIQPITLSPGQASYLALIYTPIFTEAPS